MIYVSSFLKEKLLCTFVAQFVYEIHTAKVKSWFFKAVIFTKYQELENGVKFLKIGLQAYTCGMD